MIVENTFTCVADMAGLMLPFLRPFLGRGSPLRNAIRSPWDNAALLSRPAGSTGALGGPLLMMASGRDEMVGRQMFELRAVATKAGLDPVWEEFPEAHERTRKWVLSREAADMVAEPELQMILRGGE